MSSPLRSQCRLHLFAVPRSRDRFRDTVSQLRGRAGRMVMKAGDGAGASLAQGGRSTRRAIEKWRRGEADPRHTAATVP